MELSFKIDGIAVPQGRPRTTRTGHVFTPVRSRIYRDKVREAAEQAMRRRGIDAIEVPIHLSIICYFPIPKAFSKKKRQDAIDKKINPANRAVGDVDNLAKAIMDGMSGTVMTDDAQVVTLYVAKHYAENPYAEVFVEVDDDAEEQRTETSI